MLQLARHSQSRINDTYSRRSYRISDFDEFKIYNFSGAVFSIRAEAESQIDLENQRTMITRVYPVSKLTHLNRFNFGQPLLRYKNHMNFFALRNLIYRRQSQFKTHCF